MFDKLWAFYLSQLSPNNPFWEGFRLGMMKNARLEIDFICAIRGVFFFPIETALLRKLSHPGVKTGQTDIPGHTYRCVLPCHYMQTGCHNNCLVNCRLRTLFFLPVGHKSNFFKKKHVSAYSHNIILLNSKKSTLQKLIPLSFSKCIIFISFLSV